MTEGFERFKFLGHEHLRCLKCGAEFCGNDVGWAYHECDEDD